MSRLLLVAASVFVVNLPFGFWRAGVPRLSRPWFLAVHLPVPLVILLRWVSGLGFQLATFPVMVGAFFAGQLAGGMLRRLRGPGASPSPSKGEYHPARRAESGWDDEGTPPDDEG